jgi:hypothetical protein
MPRTYERECGGDATLNQRPGLAQNGTLAASLYEYLDGCRKLIEVFDQVAYLINPGTTRH